MNPSKACDCDGCTDADVSMVVTLAGRTFQFCRRHKSAWQRIRNRGTDRLLLALGLSGVYFERVGNQRVGHRVQ